MLYRVSAMALLGEVTASSMNPLNAVTHQFYQKPGKKAAKVKEEMAVDEELANPVTDAVGKTKDAFTPKAGTDSTTMGGSMGDSMGKHSASNYGSGSGAISGKFFCANKNDPSQPASDGDCMDAQEAMPGGGCDMSDSGKCGGSVLNNLYTNCTLALYPIDKVQNPFWCFEPADCGHVMQQGFMTGYDDSQENSYCCSSIRSACDMGKAEVWKDYWCSTGPDVPSPVQKCANIGAPGSELNKKCLHSAVPINHCCCSGSACFGGDSLVTLSDGSPRRIADLQKGEIIETPAGLEEVLGFMHDSDKESRDYLAVKHEFGEFNVSSGHMIFLASGKSVLAGDLEVGSVLASPKGASSIQSIGVVTVNEFKAPLTKSGMLTVGGVHASTYSDIGNHGVAHLATFPMRMGEALSSATGAASGLPSSRIPASLVSA